MKCPCSLSNMLLQPTPCVIRDGLVFCDLNLILGWWRNEVGEMDIGENFEV